jgi:quinol monooxygenase YgiN
LRAPRRNRSDLAIADVVQGLVILIAGTVDFDPARRDAALRAAAPLLEPTRAQPGCLAYAWSADPVEAGRVHVFEAWADEAALAAHFDGPWYKSMLGVLAAHGLRGADVAKYRSDLREPVYDANGRPRADFFTAGG